MKKRWNQFIALLLVVVLVSGAVPVEALAAGITSSALETDLQQTENYKVLGTNSVGTMLAEEMLEYEQLQNEQYNVIDIKVSEKNATVSYNTLEDCTVVVAIYDESGKQMLASGKTTAKADANEVTVTIETAAMPEYFIVSAYLLDVVTMQPLCESYTSENYTKDFQEFLAKTTDDFPQDRVLNLDESKQTNFAVYGEDTIVIERKDGVNIVETADFENEIYIITNIDESIRNLKVGDVVAYQYDDSNVLIVEIGTIQINGTTATITGAGTAMEDAFSYVKIESKATEEDFKVDNSDLEEGIIPAEAGVEEQEIRPMTADEGYSKREEKELKYDFVNKTFESLSGKEKITLNGNVLAKVGVEVKFYLEWGYQYLEVIFDYSVAAHAELSGKIEERAIELGHVWVNPIAGVYITVTPKIIIEATATITADISWYGEIGFSCSNKAGIESKNKNPQTDSYITVEGKLFAGLAIEPAVSIVCEKVAEASLEGMAGIELYGILKYEAEEEIDEKHECISCLDGDISLRVRVKVYAKFFNNDELKFDKTLMDDKWKFADFYYSFDKNKAGFGECPYIMYRLKITVKGRNSGLLHSGVQITIENLEGSWETDENGECTIYLPNGTYSINCKRYDDKTITEVTIAGSAKEIEITMFEMSSGGNTGGNGNGSEDTGAEGDGNSGSEEDSGSGSEGSSGNIVNSGTCGENLQWSLDDEGTLRIWGSGEMEDYGHSNVPWIVYRKDVKKVIIEEGVTNIGCFAFYGCKSLSEIELPESITSIGYVAFDGCESLIEIELPESITSIGNSAFGDCKSLIAIDLPESLRSIEWCTFIDCESLTTIKLPESITSIEDYAFVGCESLTTIKLPESITSIGNSAFEGCESLTTIKLPESITSIGEYAFYDCKILTDIYILNPSCIIRGHVMNNYTANIHGYPDSTAEEYANEYGNPFISLETTVTTLSLKEEQSYEQEETVQLLAYVESNSDGEKTVSFSNLTPNTQYVLLVVKSETAPDVLSADNLLYIGQKKSDTQGAVSFSYIPREDYTGAVEIIPGYSKTLVETIVINQSNTSINVKNQLQLTATVLPQNATNQNIAWTSSDTSIATVDSTGLVTAVGTGQVTITATAQDGSGVQASIIINVTSNGDNNSGSGGDGTGSTEGGSGSSGDNSSGGGNSSSGGSSSSGGNSSSGGSNSGGAGSSDNQNSNNSGSEDLSVGILYYVVNFDANGGTKLSRKKMTLLKDDNLGILPSVQRKNYKFLGWYTQKTGGTKVKKSSVLNASTTLFAHWKKVTKPAKEEIISLKSDKDGEMTVKFKKLSGVAGYQITYSTSKDFAASKTQNILVSSTSKTVEKLKEGTTYYIKVRAYKKDSTGKKIYGKYSKVKAITLKEA